MDSPTYTLTDTNFFQEYTAYYAPPSPPALVTVNNPQPSDNNALKQTAFNEAASQDMGVYNAQQYAAFIGEVNIWFQGPKTGAMPPLPKYKIINVALYNQWYTQYTTNLGDAPPHYFLVDFPLPPAPVILASAPLPPPPPPSFNPIGASVGGGYYYSTSFGALLPAGYKYAFAASPTGFLYHYVNTLFGFDFWHVAPPSGN